MWVKPGATDKARYNMVQLNHENMSFQVVQPFDLPSVKTCKSSCSSSLGVELLERCHESLQSGNLAIVHQSIF